MVVRPDGQQVCVSTMDGHLAMFNTVTAAEEGSIYGRPDLGLSKDEETRLSAKTNSSTK